MINNEEWMNYEILKIKFDDSVYQKVKQKYSEEKNSLAEKFYR